MNLVNDNAILLAGATGRVGGATLATLVREGARVAVVSRDRARAAATIAAMLEPPERERAVPVAADLGDPASAAEAVQACVRAFGRIDAVVNLAGSGAGSKPLTGSALEDLRHNLAAYTETAFNLALPALRAMLAQPFLEGTRSRGRIVTVTAGSSKIRHRAAERSGPRRPPSTR